MLVNIKKRQKMARQTPVRVMQRDTKGLPVTWRVWCNQTCGTRQMYHTVHLDRKLNLWFCDCPGCIYGHVCVHILAVHQHELRGKKQAPSFWQTPEEAARQHRRQYVVQAGTAKLYLTVRKV